MPREVPRILFASGGTGGHIYPAIAIADAIKKLAPQAQVVFAGTRDRLEWQAVPEAGYPIHPIRISGLQRSFTAKNLSLPVNLLRGMYDGWKLVKNMNPDVAVGTGGYVSGPVLFSAMLQGVPYVLQEQNAYAGLTNRILGRWATEIYIAFEEARGYLPAEKCSFSGNPTRAELIDSDRVAARAHFDLPKDALVLFVFGGSLGSEAINDAVESNYEELLSDERVHILWQTGSRYFDQIYERLKPHPRLQLLKYVNRMDLGYAAADLVVSRAGAITCSELMVTGTPSILIPSPNVTEDHQTKNATSMTSSDAALLLPEDRLQTDFQSSIRMLLGDNSKRSAMTTSALELARPEAAKTIAKRVLALAQAEAAIKQGGRS